MNTVLLAAVLWSAAGAASAQPAARPEPEDCMARPRDRVVESVTYGGTTYRFRRPGCRALFESDSERYSQLFDALAQLEAEGVAIEPELESLVPS